MATLKEIQNQIKEFQGFKNRQELTFRFGKQFLLKKDREIAALERLEKTQDNEARLAGLKREKAQAEKSVKDAKENGFPSIKEELLNARLELLKKTPKDWLNELPDHTPFLLFPIKIETKFAKNSDGGHELWVRFFPDKITAESHEEAMTDAEIEDGRLFWETVFASRSLPEEEQEQVARGAWTRLVNTNGPNRSYWIAKSNRPSNIDFVEEGEELSFPNFDFVKETGWVEPPQTKALPDRFHVLAFRHNNVDDKMVLAREAFGNLIPDTLQLGPDPSNWKKNLSETLKRVN